MDELRYLAVNKNHYIIDNKGQIFCVREGQLLQHTHSGWKNIDNLSGFLPYRLITQQDLLEMYLATTEILKLEIAAMKKNIQQIISFLEGDDFNETVH